MTNEELQAKIESLEKQLQTLYASGTFPYEVDMAIQNRLNINRFEELLLLPAELQDAPLAAISNPTGGATQDAEARTAINTIISRLSQLGLIS